MKRKSHPPRNLALPLACSVVVGAPALMPAMAQDAAPAAAKEPDIEQIEKVVVTGSNIPVATGAIPAAPLEIATTPQVERSGATDTLEVLKRISSSFSGSGNTGQTVNNGGSGEAYVALRNMPTLVLLDGQRLANSSFSQGGAVDLNTIPLGMIDRIEILKDGASAIYGADAIGGVVNVITKKDFTGADLYGRYGFTAGQDGSQVSEEVFSIVAGTSTEKTYATLGGSYYHMDPLLTVDRAPGNYTNAQLYDRNVTDANGSGRFPGRVGASILAGDTQYLAPTGSGYVDPNYVPGLISPPVFPGMTFKTLGDYNAYAAATGYNVNGQTYSTPPYAGLDSIGSEPVQKSPYGLLFYFPQYTYSIQEQNRDNAFANFSHDLIDKKVQLYGRFMYAHTVSQSQLAPSPVGNLFADGKISVPANNPYNPFGIPLGAGGYTDPSNPAYDPTFSEPNVRTRFNDFGPREFEYQKDYFHFAGGLKGELSDRYSYDATYGFNRSDELATTKNAVNSYALNQALTPNLAVDPSGKTSMLRDYASNAYAPTYNIFALGGVGANEPATINAIRSTLYQSGISELWNASAQLTGTPVDLPAGPLAFAAGGQYIEESLTIDFDALQKQGMVPGLNPAFPTPRSTRDRWAGFAEVTLPLFSPDNSLPALHLFEISASGRYETLHPGGDSAVPKVGFRWQPIDEQLTLRGTYSQGFVAPSIYTIYGAPLVSNPILRLPNGSAQEQVMYLSNPALPSADSDNYSAGLVFSPNAIHGLTLAATYYYISQENIPYNPDPNTMAADLNAASAAGDPASSAWYLYYTKPNGERLQPGDQLTHGNFGNLGIPTLPGAAQQTDGFDFAGQYTYDTKTIGTLDFFANANLLLNYEFRAGPGEEFFEYGGQFTDVNYIGQGQGTLPDYTVVTGVTWSYAGLVLTINARYVPGVDDLGDNHPYLGGTASGTGNGATVDGTTWKVEDWYSIDTQLAYTFRSARGGKWYDNTRLAFGVNNITDNAPPLIASSTEDHTDKSTYDALGRFFYLEIGKKF